MRGPAPQRLNHFPEPHRGNGAVPALAGLAGGADRHADQPATRGRGADLALTSAFCATVARYLATVLPTVTRELAHWHRGAQRIVDPALRSLALQALSKRGNMEGAALFAVLAPRARRREAIRALVAFQTTYNYLDILAEQPSADPIANARRLHEALLVALDPSASHVDYYAHHPGREDGGYLPELVDACRSALQRLPSHEVVASTARTAGARIVAFQSLNLTRRQGGHDELERWTRAQGAGPSGLQWFQTAAAGGSSLAVHALIAAAANPALTARQVAEIEACYHPWICALHSLLDSLIDVQEDEQAGHCNLLSYHGSPRQSSFAMGILAQRAGAQARSLPAAHEVILTAMVAYYLSSPQARAPDARQTVAAVTDAAGPLLSPALALFKIRRAAARVVHGAYG